MWSSKYFFDVDTVKAPKHFNVYYSVWFKVSVQQMYWINEYSETVSFEL